MTRLIKKILLTNLIFLLLTSTCLSQQSVWGPSSQRAENIVTIWWVLFIVSLLVFIAVITGLLWSLIKREREKGLSKILTFSSLISAVLLVLTLIFSYQFSPKDPLGPGEVPYITVEVQAHQYWWRVKYFDQKNKFLFETANEITIPKGKKTQFRLITKDVIHSFWVPRLAGKIDMIPGRINYLNIRPKKSGRFRGQCAEFCGVQHAKMAFFIEVVSIEQFRDWMIQQQRPAVAKQNASFHAGKKVFRTKGCVRCHAVRGLFNPKSPMGPDLTHLAQRKTLAAASFPNNKGYLAGWISDPQSAKPGNHMPAIKMDSKEFNLLLKFLRGLK